MPIETWSKTDGNGIVIEQGRVEKPIDSITLKKDSKGNIQWEIKIYSMDIHEAVERAIQEHEFLKEKFKQEVEE